MFPHVSLQYKRVTVNLNTSSLHRVWSIAHQSSHFIGFPLKSPLSTLTVSDTVSVGLVINLTTHHRYSDDIEETNIDTRHIGENTKLKVLPEIFLPSTQSAESFEL